MELTFGHDNHGNTTVSLDQVNAMIYESHLKLTIPRFHKGPDFLQFPTSCFPFPLISRCLSLL